MEDAAAISGARGARTHTYLVPVTAPQGARSVRYRVTAHIGHRPHEQRRFGDARKTRLRPPAT
eukprot:2243163-Prymnesium_polylepis.1